jgi:DNA-binding transcriptional regulator YiaG
VDAQSVRNLRKRLNLTQQAFASLLGFSFVSVNRWEQKDGSSPTGLSVVILQLLESVLRSHPPSAVIAALRPVGGEPLDVVRTLTGMEKAPHEQPRK